MSKKIRFLRGGALGADGKPLVWEISKQPALSREVYLFVPGAEVEVSDSDAAWLMNPQNTGGRVFELVDQAGQSAAPQGVPQGQATEGPSPDLDTLGKGKSGPQGGGR
jgi:hypothetical protein